MRHLKGNGKRFPKCYDNSQGPEMSTNNGPMSSNFACEVLLVNFLNFQILVWFGMVRWEYSRMF